VKTIPLVELIVMCNLGIEEAREELKSRWNIDWHELDRQVDRLKGENR
jgi:hypothetical protein